METTHLEEVKQTKHTPGPWEACHDGNCSCGMIWSRHIDTCIAAAISTCRKDETYNLGEGISNKSEQFRANVKLIAAAPELLEVCQKALIHLEEKEIEKGLQEDIKLAIKKATSHE